MAITLVTKPKLYCPAHREVAWKFTMDDIGTPPISKDFGFHIADGSNTQLTDNDSQKPYAAGFPIIKDVVNDARGMVSTSLPTESTSAQTDSNIVKQIKLAYGEVTYNSEDCEGGSDITTYTPAINLINANTNSRNHSLFGDSTGFTGGRTGLLLSERPDTWKLHYGSKDYLWYLGVGQIIVKWYNGTAQLGSTQTFNLTGDTTVKYICLDHLLYSITTAPTHATVSVTDGTMGETPKVYTINYRCGSTQDEYIGIMFLDQLGGRSMFATSQPTIYGVDKDYDLINRPFDYTQTDHRTGGASIFNTENSDKLTFRTEVDQSAGFRTWIKNFLSSSEYHIQQGYGASNYKWFKFILDKGSFTVYERNTLPIVQFTGILSEQINTQFTGL